MKRKESIRNIAIIAHVDHGKTTLVDGMLHESGTFRKNQEVQDRVMDSMDIERERGITILAKNTSVWYKDIKINIMDTPGHADFGGEVERGLSMVDGAMLLVDASEGPLPQTRFVLKKALQANLPVILAINKIDRKDARPQEVVNEVYDLFIDLGATDEQIEFPILYTNAKDGIAHIEEGDGADSLLHLFETIINKIPGPLTNDDALPQFLVTNLDYDPYVGQLAIGRLQNGRLKINDTYALCAESGQVPVKLAALFQFKGLERVQAEEVEAGDIIAIAGVENVTIGDTITDLENPQIMPRISIDEPTVSMVFAVNTSPFAGKEGKYLTSRHLKERLEREMLKNVSLKVLETERPDAFEVCGRGELQLAVLIETMRREGYELMASKPEVILHQENGKTMEPFEKVYVDVPENSVGVVTEKLSIRKGRMLNMHHEGNGRVEILFRIPSRGLIGFRNEFLTDTRGSGIMNSLFDKYDSWAGSIQQRPSGALVADRAGRVTAYACLGTEDRGNLFIEPGVEVYAGMIIGERNKETDLEINITREKKLTNMRSSTSDATVTLKKPIALTLDRAIEFISDDELVEVTPQNIRMRKAELNANVRGRMRKKAQAI